MDNLADQIQNDQELIEEEKVHENRRGVFLVVKQNLMEDEKQNVHVIEIEDPVYSNCNNAFNE